MRIIGYVYEAAMHCPNCTSERFPTFKGIDTEGNKVGIVTDLDESGEEGDYCDDCLERLE